MSLRLDRLGVFVSLVSLVLVTACSGGGGGGSSGGASTFSTESDVIVTDAAVDELESFMTRIESIALVSATGTAGSNLLDAPVTLDLIGAGTTPRWVARESLTGGTYRGVQMVLTGGSTSAIARSGDAVAVTVNATTFELPFASMVSFPSDSYRQLVLDVDLLSSLTGSPTSPPLVFEPTGTASITAGGAAFSVIDEVKSRVKSVDASSDRIVIDAFGDGDATVPLGEVRVDITADTLLLDHGSVVTSTDAFLAALVPNTTLVEVHGRLSAGRILATRIEREDGTGGPAIIARLDGRIGSLSTATSTFDLHLIEIEQGANALPALRGGGSIPVRFDTTTVVLQGNALLTPAELAAGQRVKVKFAAFSTAPYFAEQIEIEAQPDYEGRITNIAGAPPATITIRLRSGEPALEYGAVADTTTPVVVNLAGSTLVLGTPQSPVLSADQLVTGLMVDVRGPISGPPAGPTVSATSIEVHPGRAHGSVMSTAPLDHTFEMLTSSLDDPFGDQVVFGRVTVELDPACRFEGVALTEGQLFFAFTQLVGLQELRVEVQGIGTATPNRVRAYYVKSSVE